MKYQTKLKSIALASLALATIQSQLAARAQGTAITYQGRLNSGGSAVNGSFDLSFALFNTNATGAAIAGPVTNLAVAVSNGLFTTMVDFGPGVFTGSSSNWLEIGVRTNGGGGTGTFSTLTPRQALTPTPYAITAASLAAVAQFNSNNSALFATVGGGSGNTATTYYATISGGYDSLANASYSTVGGGGANAATNESSTVAGGFFNLSGGEYASVGGGAGNISVGQSATVAGGEHNSSTGDFSTTGGGEFNLSGSYFTTVSGGYANTANGYAASVGGGYQNTNGSSFGTVAGGNLNSASASCEYATVGGGYQNIASGFYSTVPGGGLNTASGNYSLAAGRNAQALHAGSFVWADDTSGAFASTVPNQFSVRAGGGVLLAGDVSISGGASAYHHLGLSGGNSTGFLYGSYAALGDGVHLGYNYYADANGSTQIPNTGGGTSRISLGYGEIDLAVGGVNSAPNTIMLRATTTGVCVNGTVSNCSDRSVKQDFAPVSSTQVLDKVLQMPVTEWSYKIDAGTRHIGPMAQDFYAAFSLGMDDKHIATIDESGVALAAIQGLNQKLEAEAKSKDAEIAELKQGLSELKQLVQTLNQQH